MKATHFLNNKSVLTIDTSSSETPSVTLGRGLNVVEASHLGAELASSLGTCQTTRTTADHDEVVVIFD